MPAISSRRVLGLLAWALAVAVGVQRTGRAIHAFDNSADLPAEQRRDDGNSGHAQIDFGGQWVMGRLVATGRGRQLYDRNAQWAVVREAFPIDAESPWVRANNFPKPPGVRPFKDDDPCHDAEWMMHWFMGQDSAAWPAAGRAVALPLAASHPLAAVALMHVSRQQLTPEVVADVSRKAVGGPLYPPVHGFAMAPLGIIPDPHAAYRVMQGVLILAVVLAGLGVSRLSEGRVAWPVAVAFLFFFTGFEASLDLAQNSAVTVLILVWGWVLLKGNRDLLGGAVWGLLVYKPLWGATFFLVPLMMGRVRFCAAMVLTGAGLAAATLPFVGVAAWLDWLAVGKEASELYNVNRNWVFLSRDLFGLPRRVFLDTSLPEAERHRVEATVLGWALWFLVLLGTAVVFLRHPARKAVTGPAAGFALLGAYLCCYRFIYYDAFVAAFPLAVLLADLPRGRRTVPVGVVAALLLLENHFVYRRYELVGTPLHSGVEYPWDTLLLLSLWAWVGVRSRRERRGAR